jgi:hypothetical protein
MESSLKNETEATSIVFLSVASSLKNEQQFGDRTQNPEHSYFPVSSSLKNETITSIEPYFHPPFSFFSSRREIDDNLKVSE